MPLMEAELRVQEFGTGREGVTVPDHFGLSDGGDGAQVAWYGQAHDSWAERSELIVLGKYDAVANIDKCSARHVGGGEKACIFATIGADGPKCQRYSGLRMSLILLDANGGMRARRKPTGPYPGCQTEGL